MEENKNKLEVNFTDENKSLNYSGSLGSLIGNTMTLLQMIYRSIRNRKNRHIFKVEVEKCVNSGIVFMSNEDIAQTITAQKKEGEDNE